MTYYEAPEGGPLWNALRCVTGGQTPPEYVKGFWYTTELDDDLSEKLHAWAVNAVVESGNAWMTGIGALDAADLVVREAVSNGNIPPSPRTKPYRPFTFRLGFYLPAAEREWTEVIEAVDYTSALKEAYTTVEEHIFGFVESYASPEDEK